MRGACSERSASRRRDYRCVSGESVEVVGWVEDANAAERRREPTRREEKMKGSGGTSREGAEGRWCALDCLCHVCGAAQRALSGMK